MTNKACFVLQITAAVLLIAAMIFFMVYCCGVTLPQMRDHYYSNLETGTGMYGVIVILIFMAVAAIYVIFGICGILTGVYMFVISLVLNKKQPRRFGQIALYTIAQLFLILIALVNIVFAINGGVEYLIIAIVSSVSCLLWAAQFFAIASHMKSKTTNTH